jgi:hypothetical protein
MAAFDDGTPLDASLLQDFDRRLVELKASIPKIGATPGNPGSGGGNQPVNPSQISGGLHTGVKLSPGAVTPFTIKFTPELFSDPKSIVLTPLRSAHPGQLFSFVVHPSTLSRTGVSGEVRYDSRATGTPTIGFYWMAICF